MKLNLIYRIFHNFGYKVFSLFLALIIWYIIQGEQVIEEINEIRVNLQVPEGYEIRGDRQRRIAATIKGPRVLMVEAPKYLEAFINLPPKKGSKLKIRVDKDNIRNWSDSLSIMIHDPYITLFIDEKASRIVPIKELLQGTPAEGLFLKKIIVKPRRVKITGLKTDLMKIREISTEPIDINGIGQNKSYEVNLIPPVGYLKSSLSHETTTVTLNVEERHENKRYSSIRIEVVGSNHTYKVRPKYASIVIQAATSVLKFVKRRDLKAFVEVRDLGPGSYERDIKVKIPPDTVLIESFPEKAIVTILDDVITNNKE